MNNDLISREALKKSIKSYADDQYAENEYLGEYAIMSIIDKAPAVEYTFEEAFQKTVCEQRLYCPEKPQGDLISREALKEQFNHLEMVTNNSSIVEQAEYKMLMTCISLIDNAPTVEAPTELCKDCRFLKDCETCEEKLRPQGEWLNEKYVAFHLTCN